MLSYDYTYIDDWGPTFVNLFDNMDMYVDNQCLLVMVRRAGVA
jgi:hypothetical protein